MLYGGPDGYKAQKKTPFFSNLDTLRDNWQKAMQARNAFRAKCQKDPKKWPQNYKANAQPYNDKVQETHTEYDNLRQQIENHQAAIFQHASGDLSALMLEQEESK